MQGPIRQHRSYQGPAAAGAVASTPPSSQPSVPAGARPPSSSRRGRTSPARGPQLARSAREGIQWTTRHPCPTWSLRVYTVLPHAGTLALTAVYDNLAGAICSLDVIPHGTSGGSRGECARCAARGAPSAGETGGGGNGGNRGSADNDGLAAIFADNTIDSSDESNARCTSCVCAYDGLLLGFSGHPRLSLVYRPGPRAMPRGTNLRHPVWARGEYCWRSI